MRQVDGIAAPRGKPMLICDLTQSYSPHGGGGISTYLREKRDYVLAHTPHSPVSYTHLTLPTKA